MAKLNRKNPKCGWCGDIGCGKCGKKKNMDVNLNGKTEKE